MSTPAVVYRVVTNVQKNDWDDALQATVAGHEIKAVWFSNLQVVLRVFIPDTLYSAENVDKVIREQGAKADAVAALGS